MADHPHTIDRWDDATGENLIEQIAAVGDYLVALATYARIYDLGPTVEKGDRHHSFRITQCLPYSNHPPAAKAVVGRAIAD